MALELHIWFTDEEKEHDADTLWAIGEEIHRLHKGVHPLDWSVEEVADHPTGENMDNWEVSLLDLEMREKENDND